MKHTLAEYTNGRDNNLNLIRFFCAFLVLFSHSYALTKTSESHEPLSYLANISLGSVAVDIFFIISGFLITKSYINKTTLTSYIKARALRIYPALIPMTIFCIILGGYHTTLPIKDYFTNTEIFKFFINNSILLFGIEHNLPNVFHFNPFPNEVNGSLWALRYEIKMYALLAFIYSTVLFLSKKFNCLKLKFIFLTFTTLSLSFYIFNHFVNIIDSHYPRLFSMFFMGATYYLWRDTIKFRSLSILFISAILCISLLNKNIFFVTYCLTLPIIIFYLAYIPSGFIRKYNKLGDYSYGLYIYAFPIQQAIVSYQPNISVQAMVFYSFIITLLCAILSWHIIEKYFLDKKKILKISYKKALKTKLS